MGMGVGVSKCGLCDRLSFHKKNRSKTSMMYVFVVLSLKRSTNTITLTVIGLIIIIIVDSLGHGYAAFAPDSSRVIGRHSGA